MKKYFYAILFALVFSGCKWFAPNSMQIDSLEAQTVELKKINENLTRIANALERQHPK